MKVKEFKDAIEEEGSFLDYTLEPKNDEPPIIEDSKELTDLISEYYDVRDEQLIAEIYIISILEEATCKK